MSILGKDDFGKFYLEEFNNLGINLSTSLNEEQPTGTCLILITPDGERTMLTSLGAAALFSPVNIDEDLIKRSEWVYMEGYKFSEDSSSEAIKVASELAKKHGTKVAVTFSDIFITENFRDKISEVLKNTELIFCNEAEALSFTQTSNEDDAFAKLSEICQNVVMTRGSRGSLIKWGDKNYEISSFPVKVMDTTGAGDSFAGAFFYGISHLDSVEKAGRLASLVASKIVSQFGARYNNDMKDLLKVI
jgi:sugar/nucleoside kinase (ribokinase family)